MRYITVIFIALFAVCNRHAFAQKTIEVDSVFGVINQ
jgi:hypothetical protein